jgi:hypothetical protein
MTYAKHAGRAGSSGGNLDGCAHHCRRVRLAVVGSGALAHNCRRDDAGSRQGVQIPARVGFCEGVRHRGSLGNVHPHLPGGVATKADASPAHLRGHLRAVWPVAFTRQVRLECPRGAGSGWPAGGEGERRKGSDRGAHLGLACPRRARAAPSVPDALTVPLARSTSAMTCAPRSRMIAATSKVRSTITAVAKEP